MLHVTCRIFESRAPIGGGVEAETEKTIHHTVLQKVQIWTASTQECATISYQISVPQQTQYFSAASSMIIKSLLVTIGTLVVQLRAIDATGLFGNILGCLDPTTVDYSHDYFQDKVSPVYSKLWNISYHNTYKIVHNKFHNVSYLLYQCGSKPPSSEIGRHNATFVIPPSSGVGITESDQIPSLEQLNLRMKIKAFIGSPKYIASPCLQKLRYDICIRSKTNL